MAQQLQQQRQEQQQQRQEQQQQLAEVAQRLQRQRQQQQQLAEVAQQQLLLLQQQQQQLGDVQRGMRAGKLQVAALAGSIDAIVESAARKKLGLDRVVVKDLASCAELVAPASSNADVPLLAERLSNVSHFRHYLLLLVRRLEETGAAGDPQVLDAIQELRQVLEQGDPPAAQILQALGPLHVALSGAAGAGGASDGDGGGQWWSKPLSRCFKLLDASQRGAAAQHLMEADSLGVPLLVALTAGELCESMVFHGAPVVAAAGRGAIIRTAVVTTSSSGLPDGRKRAAMQAQVLGKALELLLPDGQAPSPLQLEGTVYVHGWANGPGAALPARQLNGVLIRVKFFDCVDEIFDFAD